MEAERNTIPSEKLTTGHTEIASLFEEIIFIASQSHKLLANQGRINIFSRVINKTSKVKEVVQSLDLVAS